MYFIHDSARPVADAMPEGVRKSITLALRSIYGREEVPQLHAKEVQLLISKASKL
jgi:hypothetical protein